ncbi:MAG: sulfate adenylyltransferase subunit 1 [Acutalibacteraceae bacterium]
MRDLLKFITCGSVDDGKSTLIGHILYDAKLLFADQEEALILDSKVGSRSGDIDYSLLLDGLMAEREQGITIDVAYRYFTTENRSFIVADTPGHEEYTRNMAVGASFADLAIILVDATQGVLVQTKRHARICRLMGINYFVFAVNKMDLADYSEKVFENIVSQIKLLAEELKLENVKIIPVSATLGDNVTKASEAMPWYNGETILAYLENVDINVSNREKGFYMPVQRVCRPDHTFRGFQGQIESGTIKTGDEITVLPSRETAVVKAVFTGDKESGKAASGQPVTICLDREIDVSRGCVLKKDNDIEISSRFDATVLWMDDVPLSLNKEYFIKLGTKRIAAKIDRIYYKTEINSGEHLPAEAITKNEIAFCGLVLAEAIPVDTFTAHKTLGEFILIDRISNMTSACGVVEKVNSDEISGTYFKDAVSLRTHIFDEFVFDSKVNTIDTVEAELGQLCVGDEIPLKGKSYNYPADFNILNGTKVVKIRKGRLAGVSDVSDSDADSAPTVNNFGFKVNLQGRSLSQFNDAENQTEWLSFSEYRSVYPGK